MDHPTSVTYPDGSLTTYDYGAYALPLTITEAHAPIGSTVSVLDDLGRLSRQTLATGAVQEKTYDALNNVLSVSNWHYPGAGSPTDGYTSYTYDALGRALLACNPDNGTPAGQCSAGASYKQTSYNANSVTSVDEAGKSWTYTTDAFGDLTQILEPGSLTTLHGYDPLGRLLSVNQQGTSGDTARTRSFSYDSLSRLLTSTNPEAGTIGYTYDADSNVSTKTDARGITTSYTYDALNRLTFKRYSDGTPVAAFGYDGNNEGGTPLLDFGITSNNAIGRLSLISNEIYDGTAYSYDTMGRLVLAQYDSPSSWYTNMTAAASYDFAGNMTNLTYPDGHHIQQTFDTAGRVSGSNLVDIGGTATAASYLQSINYLPDGSPSVTTLGNGVQQTITKNNRLQVQTMAVSNPLPPLENQTFLSHSYCYVNCTTGGTANNGNIWGITDTLNANKTQGFTYDSMNRISSFSLGGAVNQQYQIDSFGNMSPTAGNNPISTFDTATNRVNNLPCASAMLPFDAAGNQRCSTDQYGGISQYSYDAESRIAQINTLGNSASPFVSYLYGADGARVRKSNADGTFTQYVDFGGQPIAEMDEGGAWTDYIYAGGKKIAKAGGYENRIRTSATSSGNPSTLSWNLPPPQTPTGAIYHVQAGDQLCFRQIQNNAYGGPVVSFSNGMSTLSGWATSDGAALNHLTTLAQWVHRCIDISGGGQTAGSTITISVLRDWPTPAGYGDIWYGDMSITSLDGTVTSVLGANPTFGGSQTFTGDYTNSGAVSVVEHFPATGVDTAQPTRFYLGDHLGSAQLEFAMGGWPMVSSQFAPYGAELTNTASSDNHNKFTGKERDTESGLDYFGARYSSSNMGRFMSPDPTRLSIMLDNPQSWNRYAYVNNNPLSFVDDNGLWPTKIHKEIIDAAFGAGGLNLSPQVIAILKKISKQQDGIFNGGQSNALAFEHGGMSSPTMSPADSAIAGEAYLEGQELSAMQAQEQFWESDPDSPALSATAMMYYGRALHYIEDAGSPAHAGNQKWDWRNPINVIKHHFAENKISPSQFQTGVQNAMDSFIMLFGMTGASNDPSKPGPAPAPPTPYQPCREDGHPWDPCK